MNDKIEARIDPEGDETFDDGEKNSFPRITLRKSLWLGFAAILIGSFLAWFFFKPSPEGPPRKTQVTKAPQLPGNPYEEGTGRSGVYDFFYKVFGGIEDGLDDNPHNLSNVERLDDQNIDPDTLVKDPGTSTSPPVGVQGNKGIDAALALKEKLRHYETENGVPGAAGKTQKAAEYRHSLYDVFGSRVFDRNGNGAGSVYDILVNKKTGKARAIIIREDESRYARDLSAVDFRNVWKQEEGGEAMVKLTEEQIEQDPEFNYADLNKDDYISLRHLQGGQLLDMDGKVAGDIDAVIYQNAEAQNIYFTLRPVLAQYGISKFQIPFDKVKIVESPDGADIQLSKKQTEELARLLFERERAGKEEQKED